MTNWSSIGVELAKAPQNSTQFDSTLPSPCARSCAPPVPSSLFPPDNTRHSQGILSILKVTWVDQFPHTLRRSVQAQAAAAAVGWRMAIIRLKGKPVVRLKLTALASMDKQKNQEEDNHPLCRWRELYRTIRRTSSLHQGKVLELTRSRLRRSRSSQHWRGSWR